MDNYGIEDDLAWISTDFYALMCNLR